MDFAHRWHDRKLNIALANFGFLLTLLTLVGCGGKPAKVSGVATLDGKPLERGMVGFAPIDGGMRAAGIIQSDGSYTLSTNRESGLDTGEYLTTVASREPGVENSKGARPCRARTSRPGTTPSPRRRGCASMLKREATRST